MTLAGLAAAGDLLAIVLPTGASALWRARRPVLATAAWMAWIAAATLAILASVGFIELNTGDTAAGRQSIVATLAAVADQRTASIAAAQLAVVTATRAREAECMVRGPKCRDREADERAALAVLGSAIAAPIPAAPAVGTADPQVTASLRLAKWAGLPVGADDVVNLRLALMAALPNIGGLVLAFGVALRRRPFS